MNPLSQTFTVDPNQHQNGVFASSVDVFFSAVDTKLPVTLQLRPTSNGGYPSTGSILPFGEVVMNANSVNAESSTPSLATSTTYTRVTFPSPI